MRKDNTNYTPTILVAVVMAIGAALILWLGQFEPQPQPITNNIAQAETLSQFNTLLEASDVFETLQDTSTEFTILAPSSTVLTEAEVNIDNLTAEENSEQLNQLLRRHVIPEYVNIQNRLFEPVDTLGENPVTFATNTETVDGVQTQTITANGVTIDIQKTIVGDNSIVYVINDVLPEPSDEEPATDSSEETSNESDNSSDAEANTESQ